MTRSPRSRSRAFSLVEVTLAIGIVAFSLFSLLGLFSVGLKANQESTRYGVLPQIAQELERRARTGGTLPAVGDTFSATYDYDGQPATTDPIYTATGVILPGDGSGWGILEITIAYPGGTQRYHAPLQTTL